MDNDPHDFDEWTALEKVLRAICLPVDDDDWDQEPPDEDDEP